MASTIKWMNIKLYHKAGEKLVHLKKIFPKIAIFCAKSLNFISTNKYNHSYEKKIL